MRVEEHELFQILGRLASNLVIESALKATVELQGFCMANVDMDALGPAADLVPDGRYAPRCGRCLSRAAYRDAHPGSK